MQSSPSSFSLSVILPFFFRWRRLDTTDQIFSVETISRRNFLTSTSIPFSFVEVSCNTKHFLKGVSKSRKYILSQSQVTESICRNGYPNFSLPESGKRTNFWSFLISSLHHQLMTTLVHDKLRLKRTSVTSSIR